MKQVLKILNLKFTSNIWSDIFLFILLPLFSLFFFLLLLLLFLSWRRELAQVKKKKKHHSDEISRNTLKWALFVQNALKWTKTHWNDPNSPKFLPKSYITPFSFNRELNRNFLKILAEKNQNLQLYCIS